MKQTAVEWLEIEIKKFNTVITREYLLLLTKKALEMEKQQIESAFTQGEISGADYFDPANPDVPSAVNYYNQTYKS